MDWDLFLPVHSFLHDDMETCFLSDSIAIHLVQNRSPCKVPSDMGNATLPFSEGNGTGGNSDFCHCCQTQGLQTAKVEK